MEQDGVWSAKLEGRKVWVYLDGEAVALGTWREGQIHNCPLPDSVRAALELDLRKLPKRDNS